MDAAALTRIHQQCWDIYKTQLCLQMGLAEKEQSRKTGVMCTWWVRILTVIVNEKGNIRGQDLIVADLAVLRGAVPIDGLHTQDAVIQLPLRHCHAVQLFHKDGSKLIHIVYSNVHCGPDAERHQ